jgi:glutamate synthase (ferredoxin)
VGAGMTGGLAYFLDEVGNFPDFVNHAIVKVQRVVSDVGRQQLYDLIKTHERRTGSPKAQEIIANWAEYLPKFWQLVPPSEADSPEAKTEEKQLSSV